MKQLCGAVLLISVLAGVLRGQQVPDTTFVPRIATPAYAPGRGPVVGIDEAHHNLHTRTGGFAPLARLLEADGYRTQSVPQIRTDALNELSVLIVANPLHASNVGNWTLPTPSAFTPDEVAAIERWVARGGSLWLIADHMPYAGAASELARAFGFAFKNGFAMSRVQVWPPERYRKVDGTLSDNVMTQGIDSLAGFTGSALKAPSGATTLGRFPATHVLNLPRTAWQFDTNNVEESLDGLTFGAFLRHGAGRVGVFTEAAMFTAQLLQGSLKVGFTSPTAPQNQQFALNVMHWLDGDPESGA